jgi:hypothetical protein
VSRPHEGYETGDSVACAEQEHETLEKQKLPLGRGCRNADRSQATAKPLGHVVPPGARHRRSRITRPVGSYADKAGRQRLPGDNCSQRGGRMQSRRRLRPSCWKRGIAPVRCQAGARLLSRRRAHDALGSDCCSGLSPGRLVRRRRRLLTAASCWPGQALPRSRFACAPPREAAPRRPQRQLRLTVSTAVWRGCASSPQRSPGFVGPRA